MFSALPKTSINFFIQNFFVVCKCFNLDQSKVLLFGKEFRVNPLPDDKILGLPKWKACTDNKLNVIQNIKVVFHRIENIVGKEENAGYQHFFLFPQCF